MVLHHNEFCYTKVNFKKKSAATRETNITKANEQQKYSGYLKQLNKFFLITVVL